MNIVKGGDWIPENRRGWGLDPRKSSWVGVGSQKIVVGGGWIPKSRPGWGLDPRDSSLLGCRPTKKISNHTGARF